MKSPEVEVVDYEVSIRELSTIFSTFNFPLDDGNKDVIDTDDNGELDIGT